GTEEDVAGQALERPVAAIAGVAGRLLALGALAERQLARGAGRLRGLGGRRRRPVLVVHVPALDRRHQPGLRERRAAVRRLGEEDRVALLAAARREAPPEHVDGAGARDGDVAELAVVHVLGQLRRLRERAPPVGRTDEEDAVVAGVPLEAGPADVHVARVAAARAP